MTLFNYFTTTLDPTFLNKSLSEIQEIVVKTKNLHSLRTMKGLLKNNKDLKHQEKVEEILLFIEKRLD